MQRGLTSEHSGLVL